MNADAFFTIGHSHEVCQDYALAGETDDAIYAVLCDGCSSGKHTDLGARAIAHAAVSKLSESARTFNELPHNAISALVMERASTIRNLGLPFSALLATLLVAYIQKRSLTGRILMFGDGVVAIHRAGVLKTVFHVEYTDNAPFYPFYDTHDIGADALTTLYPTNRRKMRKIMFRDDGTVETDVTTEGPMHEITTIWIDASETSVSLLSDGVEQFRNADTSTRDWLEVVKEATAYKSTEGQFVRRRANAMLRKMRKDQGIHDDDFSIAAIHR